MSTTTTTTSSTAFLSFASLSDVSIQPPSEGCCGAEMKWCAFAKGTRGSIAKVVVDAVQPAVAHVRVVFVRKEYRGHGLGSLLLRQAQRTLACNGFLTLLLEAEENTGLHGRLVGMYERCGFAVVPGARETFEYNGDECFRKVAMRCELSALGPAPPALRPAAAALASFEFNQGLRRDAMEICRARPLGLTLLGSLDAVETGVAAGSMRGALRALGVARRRGHPDWMQLAAGLRGLGAVQRLLDCWRAPFAVHVERAEAAAAGGEPRGEAGDDGERAGGGEDVKAGPLPAWVCPPPGTPTRVVDPGRFPARVGRDELPLSWSDAEFAWTCLQAAGGSAPHELLQLLRYARLDDWLLPRPGTREEEAEPPFEFATLEEDEVLRDLVLIHRNVCAEADAGPPGLDAGLDELRARLEFLVDKYFGRDVCII